MSYLLWKYFYDDEIERFRKLLANTGHNVQHAPKSHGGGAGAYSMSGLGASPGSYSTSPRVVKTRKVSGQTTNMGAKGTNQIVLNRADVNSRDYAGVPLLCRIASSKSESAIDFAMALLNHPAIDLYAQDAESGWTVLHRALYSGNVTLARAILERDSRRSANPEQVIQRPETSLIKVKDHEGNSPFDVYNATIARQRRHREDLPDLDADTENGEASVFGSEEGQVEPGINGDEVFVWGSSKNYNLGVGDEDDRQYPEKITLERPDHLLFRFFREYVESLRDIDNTLYRELSKLNPKSVNDLPTLISNKPIVFQDVALSKLHSAILTTDPESNLFMCGFGPGGRLGIGDEVTRFSYVCVEGGLLGKKIAQVALGYNHSLAITSDGEIFSWGQNTSGVLGYTLPQPLKDQDPICSTPRQIFGPLKREVITGIAASAIHSVAHTPFSLYTWGRNDGQLGLMDSDSRSLDVQPSPRKVAASLFKAPIKMVSAINRATIVLLENHTVCVFTNYGYRFVPFPANEGFRNYHLQSNALTTRYDSTADNISNISACGDTIAAFSTQNLYTINVSKVDTNSATSTTNPSKIRDSLTPPQRVWSLRKGHWDGIKSASVTENGSVIVCTQAGAVWHRVKRAKVKDAFTGASSFHSKDFKFQRVPGLTNVAAVRSTAFGVYAAIRKDCDITKTQIEIDEPTLWEDIWPLLSIRDLEVSEPVYEDDAPRPWTPATPKDLLERLKRAVLISPDLEEDIRLHLQTLDEDYDTEICTSTSEISIPAHGFLLQRSPILRELLDKFREAATANIPGVITVEKGPRRGSDRTKIIFHGLDFITVVNMAIYLYTDTVVDVWHSTRQFPKMAFRYRQVRIELMKTAAHLKLVKLESSVRLMTSPDRRLNLEMGLAIQDPRFFEDADTVIELDGSEMAAHKAILCQRCPFFDGLFNGRAGGQWLAGRRDSLDIVRVDMKHVAPETFRLVLRYLYADVGKELFDDIVAADIDEFSDLVMDVMAVSNELMLDQLSQICQKVIGRFVNTRNVCHLLNAVAPCSITEFKDAALEYVCLQLEYMLENHWINDLDDELLSELDEVVRANQLACLPFAKSGRAELLLHERHPELAAEIEEERQRRHRDMVFRANLKVDDARLSSSCRTRVGSLEDVTESLGQDKGRRRTKNVRNEPFSPTLRPKDSTVDLMFDMDDDDPLEFPTPKSTIVGDKADVGSPIVPWDGPGLKNSLADDEHSLQPIVSPVFGAEKTNANLVTPTKSWSSPSLPSNKLDLREIMAQASSSRTSNLSMSLSAQKAREENLNKTASPKISQKERKKQQQKALQEAVSQPQITLDKTKDKVGSPWKVAASGSKTLLKDVLYAPTPSPPNATQKPLGSPVPARSLTMRRTASPDTRFAGQQRSVSASNTMKSLSPAAAGPSRGPSGSIAKTPLIPHSKSYNAPTSKAEPSLQLSMADIIGQQRREQEVIKEAVAKRSLQEIQEEQAFQEWWDQESRRAQEQEAVAKSKASSSNGRGGKSGGRGKGGRGRGGKGRGDLSQGRGRGRGKGQGNPQA
ncbi:putative BTB/POZ domain-containing protein 1 [Tricladium varicosporioides]|nr:putative BTB/POZ domain-containing protein 1 [Hymenoscyphus varicosporioides]